ncbi:MAG: 23S rRNA (pseudouridine(1915)-N(3))-methyltransferase RlmH, partial [Planctomycetota bacterium]|nr:23S rRNA (pseudouridine(1915)-N(3))-methyltransferase RlmH [Planctomycetota bacterium]
MRITLLTVGRLRSRPCALLCDEYLARLARYGAAAVLEVKAAAAGSAAQCVEQESARLLAALAPG